MYVTNRAVLAAKQTASYARVYALASQKFSWLGHQAAMLQWMQSPTYKAMLEQRRLMEQSPTYKAMLEQHRFMERFSGSTLWKIVAEQERHRADLTASVSRFRVRPRTAHCTRPHLDEEPAIERQPDPNFGFRPGRWEEDD